MAPDPPTGLTETNWHARTGNVGGASPSVVNAFTVDVEDYFQVSAFERHVRRSAWESMPCRVERNMEVILGLLEEQSVKATFFTLGWIAERFPQIVRSVVSEGHELASHGYDHTRVAEQNRGAFGEDIRRTKGLLEDVGGVQVLGYRAASYSIEASNTWAHAELREAGYHYSSSIYPIRHDLYGSPTAPRLPFCPIRGDQGFIEVPITTLELGKQRFPCGGGGYFRLFPYMLSRWAIERVNRGEGVAAVFYCHPWEVDPEQPRIGNIPFKTRLRHYLNLHRTEARLRRLLADFHWHRMDRIYLRDNRLPRAERSVPSHGVNATARTEYSARRLV